jgi:cytochrome P450
MPATLPPPTPRPAPTTEAAPTARVTERRALPGEAVLRFQRDPLAFLRWADAAGGDIVRLRLGPTRALLLRHPGLVGEVYLAPPGVWPKGPQVEFAVRTFGTSLLTSEPPHHTRVRKLVLPAFAHGRLAGYAETVVRLAEAHAGRWLAAGTLDLVDAASRLSYAVAEATLFGGGGLRHGAEVRDGVTEALLAFDRIVRNPPLMALADYVPVPAARRLDRVRARLVAVVAEAVRQRRRAGDPGDDILGLLLLAQDEETGAGLSDAEVVDEALTLLLAGHETTASALAWAWLLLAEHPDAEARLADEARDAGDLDMDALRRLPYARAVFAEAMRLYPPAYLLDRAAPGPRTIGGIDVEPGTAVFVSPYLLHRDPRFWEHPEAFRPDRPDLDAKHREHRFAYLPFSVGTRGCIGERFAWMEGTLLLAAVARRLRFRPVGGWPAPLASLTLRPSGAVPVRADPV